MRSALQRHATWIRQFEDDIKHINTKIDKSEENIFEAITKTEE